MDVEQEFEMRKKKIEENVKYIRENLGKTNKPIIMELIGTPNSGKTTLVKHLESLFKKNDISIEKRRETAEYNPIENKDLEEYNIWMVMELMRNLCEDLTSTEPRIIIYDRGVLDRLPWFDCAKEDGIISEKDFVDVNVINAVDDEINTVRSIFRMTVKNGLICSDTKQDILKTVLVDRIGVSKPSVAFVHGFGIKHGALAISISHDEHNLTSVGVKDKDIVVAINRVIEIGGGFVYAIDGKVVAEIPLKFAGLISTLTAEELTEQFEKVRPIIRDKMKCTIKHPIHTLSYLSDIEIPSLKLSLKGLFNVPGQEFIDLVCRD